MQKDSTASLGLSGAIGLGPFRLAVLGLGSAVCGSLGSLYDYQKTAEAGLPESRGLGASGMVEGIMMATMLAQPRWPVSASQYTYFPSPMSMFGAAKVPSGRDAYETRLCRHSARPYVVNY